MKQLLLSALLLSASTAFAQNPTFSIQVPEHTRSQVQKFSADYWGTWFVKYEGNIVEACLQGAKSFVSKQQSNSRFVYDDKYARGMQGQCVSAFVYKLKNGKL